MSGKNTDPEDRKDDKRDVFIEEWERRSRQGRFQLGDSDPTVYWLRRGAIAVAIIVLVVSIVSTLLTGYSQ